MYFNRTCTMSMNQVKKFPPKKIIYRLITVNQPSMLKTKKLKQTIDLIILIKT